MRDNDIQEVLKLVNFEISKGELSAFSAVRTTPITWFAMTQFLRNFLNGLIIYKRGPRKDNGANIK